MIQVLCISVLLRSIVIAFLDPYKIIYDGKLTVLKAFKILQNGGINILFINFHLEKKRNLFLLIALRKVLY